MTFDDQLGDRLWPPKQDVVGADSYTAGCNTGANVYALEYFQVPSYETR